jgi:hypothetical protein
VVDRSQRGEGISNDDFNAFLEGLAAMPDTTKVETQIPDDVRKLAIMLELAMVDWWERDDTIHGKGGSGFADPKVQHLYDILCERLWHAGSTATTASSAFFFSGSDTISEKDEPDLYPTPTPAPTTTPGLTAAERQIGLQGAEHFYQNGWIDLKDAGLVDVFATAERIALWLKTGERTKPLTPSVVEHEHEWIRRLLVPGSFCVYPGCTAVKP